MGVKMKKRKNINSTIPNGGYFKQPSNRVHLDKTKFKRNIKHKNNNYE